LFPFVDLFAQMALKKRRVPAAHRVIGTSLARRLGEDDCQFFIGWKVNATVHNIASPGIFQDWQWCFVAKPAA